MKKHLVIITVINLFLAVFFLFSYYLKKEIGYVFYNWIIMILEASVIIYSIIVVSIYKKKILFLEQLFICIFIILVVKFDLSDRFALLIEVPRIERKMKDINEKELIGSAIEVNDDFVVFEWEPGVLDYQWVVVYDKNGVLKNSEKKTIWIAEGQLKALYKAHSNYFLCILYR